MIIEHKYTGKYLSPTLAEITTFKTTDSKRIIKGKEYPASVLKETKEQIPCTFNLEAIYSISSEYVLEKESQSNFFDRIQKEGITISIPIQKGKIHSDYITVSETKKK